MISKGTTRGVAGSVAITKATLAGSLKRWSDPTPCPLDCADKTSVGRIERHRVRRRGESPQGRYPRNIRVSNLSPYLANPFPDAVREHSEFLSRSRKPREYLA